MQIQHMTERFVTGKSAPALYGQGQVIGGALFAGPIAAGWMLRENFRAMGNDFQGRSALFVSILIAMGMTPVLMWLPSDTPNALMSLILPFVYWAWYKNALASRFDDAISQGATKKTFGKAVLVTIVSLPISIVILFGVSILLPIKPMNTVSFAENAIYYEGSATRPDAELLAYHLQTLGVFTLDSAWEVSLVMPRRNTREVKVQFTLDPVPEPGSDLYRSFDQLRGVLKERLYTDREEVRLEFKNIFGLVTSSIAGSVSNT